MRERAVVVLPFGSTILLEELRHPALPDLWQTRLPGGGIEPGESPLAAIRREIEEEFGLKTDERAFVFKGIVRGSVQVLHVFELTSHPLEPGAYSVGDDKITHLVVA